MEMTRSPEKQSRVDVRHCQTPAVCLQDLALARFYTIMKPLANEV